MRPAYVVFLPEEKVSAWVTDLLAIILQNGCLQRARNVKVAIWQLLRREEQSGCFREPDRISDGWHNDVRYVLDFLLHIRGSAEPLSR